MAQGRSPSSSVFGWPLRLRPSLALAGNSVLLLLCLGSALAVIATSHLVRDQYAQLQQLQTEQQQLQTEWGQLLLEESTWAAPARIERLAGERLEMRLPEIEEIEVIRP